MWAIMLSTSALFDGTRFPLASTFGVMEAPPFVFDATNSLILLPDFKPSVAKNMVVHTATFAPFSSGRKNFSVLFFDLPLIFQHEWWGQT